MDALSIAPTIFGKMEVLTIPMVIFSLAISLLLLAGKRRLMNYHAQASRWDRRISTAVSLLIISGAVINYFYSDSVQVVLDQKSLVIITVVTAIMIDQFYSQSHDAGASSCGICNSNVGATTAEERSLIARNYLRNNMAINGISPEGRPAPKIRTFISKLSHPSMHPLEEASYLGGDEVAVPEPRLLYQQKGSSESTEDAGSESSEEHQSCDSEPSTFQATVNAIKSKIEGSQRDSPKFKQSPTAQSTLGEKVSSEHPPKGAVFTNLPVVEECSDIVSKIPEQASQSSQSNPMLSSLVFWLCAGFCAVGGALLAFYEMDAVTIPGYLGIAIPLGLFAAITGYEYTCGRRSKMMSSLDYQTADAGLPINYFGSPDLQVADPMRSLSRYCSTCTGSETYTETVLPQKEKTKTKGTSTSPKTEQVREDVTAEDIVAGPEPVPEPEPEPELELEEPEPEPPVPYSTKKKDPSTYTMVDSTSIWSTSAVKSPRPREPSVHYIGYGFFSLLTTAVFTSLLTALGFYAGYLYYQRMQELPFYRRPTTWLAGLLLLITAAVGRAAYLSKFGEDDDDLESVTTHHKKGCGCLACLGKKKKKKHGSEAGSNAPHKKHKKHKK